MATYAWKPKGNLKGPKGDQGPVGPKGETGAQALRACRDRRDRRASAARRVPPDRLAHPARTARA